MYIHIHVSAVSFPTSILIPEKNCKRFGFMSPKCSEDVAYQLPTTSTVFIG